MPCPRLRAGLSFMSRIQVYCSTYLFSFHAHVPQLCLTVCHFLLLLSDSWGMKNNGNCIPNFLAFFFCFHTIFYIGLYWICCCKIWLGLPLVKILSWLSAMVIRWCVSLKKIWLGQRLWLLALFCSWVSSMLPSCPSCFHHMKTSF